MRAAIFDPYLDSLGGGERYVITFAKVLHDLGYKVSIEWGDKTIAKKIEERFGINADFLDFVPDINRGDGYDLCFWLSDGSIPLLKARNNYLHFQFPFRDVGGKSLINKMKLFRIKKCVCNSAFTKKFIDKEYGVDSVVVYPPVGIDAIRAGRKENIIIYVGRYSRLMQAKHQDVLVDEFKSLCRRGLAGWKLIIAGGTDVGVGDFLVKLRSQAKGLPVYFLENPDFGQLRVLYGKAKIFWSASGFGINEQKEPTKVEHFGITTVEAMAGGVVPVVYKSGGPKEIIEEGESGFLWNERKELANITRKLIADKELLKKVSSGAILQSKKFGFETFKTSISEIL